MGELRKLDQNGDTKHEWDPSKPQEVDVARDLFTLYKSQGFTAARMGSEVAGEIIHEFDPNAGTIIFRPVMCGG